MQVHHLVLLALLPCVTLAALKPSGTFRGALAGDLPGPWRAHSYHKEGTQHVQTYLSAGFWLEAGEVLFTNPATTILPFPTTPAMIQSFRAEVVDVNGTSVPLYETYNHHWVVMKNNGENNIGPCHDQLGYVFGVGEECRNTFVKYPGNYRLFTTGKETWTANIHLIRTVNVPYVKQCIECHCGDPNNEYNGGGFKCCPDGSFCPTDDQPKPPAKQYFLKYTVNYDDPDPKYLPVDVAVMDASNCNVEYDIPPCTTTGDGCLVSATQTITIPRDFDIVYAVGHIHPGGINITLAANGVPVCTSVAIYGNGTEPGNENGYVVGLTTCTFDPPLRLKAGTVVTNTGLYNSTMWHDAVMSLFYIAVAGQSQHGMLEPEPLLPLPSLAAIAIN